MTLLRTLLRVLLVLLLSPIVAFAGIVAATGGEASPLNVPLVLLVASLFLSSLAAAAALAWNMLRELKANAAAGEPEKGLAHPWLFGLAHVLGSWTAGALCFIVAMARGWTVWELLGAVVVGSFGGAALLEGAVLVALARAKRVAEVA